MRKVIDLNVFVGMWRIFIMAKKKNIKFKDFMMNSEGISIKKAKELLMSKKGPVPIEKAIKEAENKFPNVPTEKEMKEYKKRIKREAKKFKLTSTDLSNLYDLFYMVDTPPEISMDFRKTLKINNMDKWFNDFHIRIEKIIIPELWKNDKKQKKKKSTKNSRRSKR